MVTIQSIDDVHGALEGVGTVVGLGVTAFPRVGIVGLVPDYQILCIKESDDVEAIRSVVPVRSVKRDFSWKKVEKLNTLALLKHEGAKEYLASLGAGTSLFIYRSSRQIEKIADGLGLRILSNRSDVRDIYEDKWEFRQIARKVGIELPTGEQLLIDDYTFDVFYRLRKKLGKRLVFQITDYAKGGGIGTFFVTDRKGFDEFHGFVQRRRAAGRDLARVNVTKMIDGESASVNACVTRHGILTSQVQRQIVDVREVVGYHGRSGVFCGHDWGKRYSERVQRGAEKLTRRLGEYMHTKGYRGIFGIDLVVDRESGSVGIVECNSRYTGAFPVFTMLQTEIGEIPMDAWHLLEFADVDYDMDFQAVQSQYERVKRGAQLILHNLERAWVAVRGSVKSGVYRMTKLKVPRRASPRGKQSAKFKVGIKWVRDGFSIEEIQRDDEFVLTDGAPQRNLRLKPGARIGRVIFRRNVMEERGNQLQPDVKQAMKILYKMYGLEKIKRET